MFRKLFYVLPLLAMCGCSSEDLGIKSGLTAMDNAPAEKMAFVRLADNATTEAGTLNFEADASEATLKWIVADGCNLDTTQTVVTLTDGKGKLPIRWEKKLDEDTYGPGYMAFKAGVIVTTGNDSQYFPLVWADEVDSTKVVEQAARSRAAGATPRASVIIIPEEVEMDELNGASMIVRYSSTTTGLVINYNFTKSMHIDGEKLPGVVINEHNVTITEIPLKWTEEGAPLDPFTAEVRVTDIDTAITYIGKVTWKANRGPSLIVTPAHDGDLPAAGGNYIGGYSLQTNQYRWTATSTATWLRVSPSEGYGHNMIYLSADANTTIIPRYAVVTVVCYDATGTKTLERTLVVGQKAAEATTLSVTPTVHDVAAAGGVNSSSITSNAAWTATSNAAWLTVSPTSGSGNGTLSFNAAQNTSSLARTATVTIVAGTLTQTVTVTQQKSLSAGIVCAGYTWAPGNLVRVGNVYQFYASQEQYSGNWNGGDYWNFNLLNPSDYSTSVVGYYWNAANDPCSKVAPAGNWRTPTIEELESLLNVVNSWGYCNGRVGRYFGPNNELFLPAAGWRPKEASTTNVGVAGLYWTSTPRYYSGSACFLGIQNNNVNMDEQGHRAMGASVRCISAR